MTRVVILGAGFAGQTAALYLRKELGKDDTVTVVAPFSYFTYYPSLVWVGVGRMSEDRPIFDLEPVYKRHGIQFKKGWAREVYPDQQEVMMEKENGETERVPYDYLVNATGPYLNFEGTPGLGPHGGYTQSICTIGHAKQCRDAYLEQIQRMEKGEQVNIVIGTGHGMSTCQGAALEYITNLHRDLLRRKVRDKAKIMWLSNEPRLGDLGVGGISARSRGYIMDSETFAKSLYAEQDIYYQTQSAVTGVEQGKIHWENYEGEQGETEFDFAMLIPQFKGRPIRYVDAEGNDITGKMTNPLGFTLVDGGYGKPWGEINDKDWPSTYQSPVYKNIFAAGIAFAPPGSISKPFVNKNGTNITSVAPRTGMASGITGKIVAYNILDMIQGKEPTHREALSGMPGACIASIDKSTWNGSAATIIMYPVAPNFRRYPEYGRDLNITSMEIGLAGAWMKRLLHTGFIYKMKGLPGWTMIPE